MCMNTENTKTGQDSPTNSSMNANHVHLMDIESQCRSTSSDDSRHSHDNTEDIVEFGPIKVKLRKRPAPTLSTGRRSKYEILTPEEEQKRDVRRARNRAAAERVRINRLNVEQQLQDQINQLEMQKQQLDRWIETLEQRKFCLQARISTHDKLCLPTRPLIISNNLTPSNFSSYTPTQLPTETNDATLVDLLLQTVTPILQNTDSDFFGNMSPDDIDDYLINL